MSIPVTKDTTMSFSPPQMPMPSAGPNVGSIGSGAGQLQNTLGAFEGAQFKIDHRDVNSLLGIMLQPGYQVVAQPGSMVSMDATVQLAGSFKFSWKKMLAGDQIAQATFTGPGEVVLAPHIWGDIHPLEIRPGQMNWTVSHHSFLAATSGVQRVYNSQGFGKGLFSGGGILVQNVQGQGMMWVQAFGAIYERHLPAGQQLVVDHGHLVAWSCQYTTELIKASGGFLSKLKTGEGFVCRFTGPGTILMQTRSPVKLEEWINEHCATGTSG